MLSSVIRDPLRRWWWRTTDTAHASRFYYAHWGDAEWLGHPIWKNPLDLWIYQELITRVRPDLIVETGTAHGGSAMYFAGLCDLLDHGRIISIDIAPLATPEHQRVEYVIGSSTDPEIVQRVTAQARTTTLVVLDSDHSAAHVSAELEAYAPLVSVGSYLIVEDTNTGGHPVFEEGYPGPMEAVAAFLPRHPEFEVDRACERYVNTFNPGGYLRRR